MATYRIMRGTAPVTIFLPESGQGFDIHSNSSGQYALRIFQPDSVGGAFQARISGSTGDIETVGTYLTSTGIRATAFGVYMGVLASSRFEFQNTGINVFGPAGARAAAFADYLLSMTRDNGQSLNVQSATELTTIAAAATTDTAIQFPADSIGLGVSVRVTVVIPTAVTFDIGVAAAATRYSPGAGPVSTAANSTGAGVGLTNPSIYAAATSVRLTMNGGVPAANTGRVRTTLHYINLTPPTS